MGSLFGTKPQVVSPPAPVYNSYVDQVNNVEQVPVTQADGTVTYVTRALPLSAEAQAQQDKLTQIKNDALGQIQALSNGGLSDPANVAAADAYTADQQKALNASVAARTQTEETALAKRGLADSATALAVRRKRMLDQQDAQSTLANNRTELLNQMRGQQLSLQQNLYNIANSNLKADAAAQYQAATNAMSKAVSADMSRQASILSYYGRQNTGTTSPFDTAFGGGLGRSIGTGLGGLFGGGAGAMLGGLFG